jgi:hypothetical protein
MSLETGKAPQNLTSILDPEFPLTSQLYVKPAVKNLARSFDFFQPLGFALDPLYTHEDAAATVLSGDGPERKRRQRRPWP